jgi:DNA-binding NarL/FixJ family response regulator
MAMLQADFASAEPLSAEAVRVARSAGELWGAAQSLIVLAAAEVFVGKHASSAAHLQEGRALFREAGDAWGDAFAVGVLGWGAMFQGELVSARALLEESQSLIAKVGDRWIPGLNLRSLGVVDALEGDLSAAEQRLRAALEHLDTISPGDYVAVDARIYLAMVLARQGKTAEAADHLKRSLRLTRELAHRNGMVDGLIAAAALALTPPGQPEPARSARLLGAAAALSATTGYAMPPIDHSELERTEAAARAALGDEAFAAAYQAGQTLTPEQALAEAELVTAAVPTTVPPDPAAPFPAGLTEREVAVLRLITRGLTSAQVPRSSSSAR